MTFRGMLFMRQMRTSDDQLRARCVGGKLESRAPIFSSLAVSTLYREKVHDITSPAL